MSGRELFCLLLALLLAVMPAAGELDLSAPTPAPAPEPGSAFPGLSAEPLLEESPLSLSCAGAALCEAESGQIIFLKDADEAREVASVTKVMTILLALEAVDQGRISPDAEITISQSASGMGGSQVLLDTGEVQPFGVLLKSMIVGSANDAAVAVAESLYGSEALFVDRMNRRAAELGMANTRFANCTGLPNADQHTTARDVAAMTLAMLNHPLYFEYAHIWMDEVDHGDGRVTQLTNTNKLIRLYDGCDGGKTGSTDAAGYCIAATAKRGGMRLVAVVLGARSSSDRFDAASEMMDYGFANYRLYPVAQSGAKIRGELPVTGGDRDGLKLELAENLTLLIQKGEEQHISLVPSLPQSVPAPVQAGQRIGSVGVQKSGRTLAEIDVIASESVDAKGFMRAILRIWTQWKPQGDP